LSCRCVSQADPRGASGQGPGVLQGVGPAVLTEPFHRFADLLPEALLLVSAGGTIRAANTAAADRLRRSAESLREAALASLTREPPDAVRHYLRNCARSRSLVLGSLVFLPESGEPLPCRCEGAVYLPRTDQDEAIVLLRLIPRDAAVSQFVA